MDGIDVDGWRTYINPEWRFSYEAPWFYVKIREDAKKGATLHPREVMLLVSNMTDEEKLIMKLRFQMS